MTSQSLETQIADLDARRSNLSNKLKELGGDGSSGGSGADDVDALDAFMGGIRSNLDVSYRMFHTMWVGG